MTDRDRRVMVATIITAVSIYVMIGTWFLPDSPRENEPTSFFVCTVLVPVVAYGMLALIAAPFMAWNWALKKP